jgi:hypothetical protein
MGAKTTMLAFTDGDLRPALLGATPATAAETEELVREVFPGYEVTRVGETTLDVTHPPDDVTYATVLPGAELLCDRRLVPDRPSELPEHLLRAGRGRWAGEHPVEPMSGLPDTGPYPLPFHPLELGEDALQALFGFVIEGMPGPDDIDADAVHLHQFRVADTTGTEPAARTAIYEQVENMGRVRMFRMGPDGTMDETGLDDPRINSAGRTGQPVPERTELRSASGQSGAVRGDHQLGAVAGAEFGQ